MHGRPWQTLPRGCVGGSPKGVRAESARVCLQLCLQAKVIKPYKTDNMGIFDGRMGCRVVEATIYTGWWFGTFFIFPILLGMSSSQLTNSIIFQRGRSTTDQYMLFLLNKVTFRGFEGRSQHFPRKAEQKKGEEARAQLRGGCFVAVAPSPVIRSYYGPLPVISRS